MTSFRCALFGSNIDSSMATNTGQPREQFQIVITASNGELFADIYLNLFVILTSFSTTKATTRRM